MAQGCAAMGAMGKPTFTKEAKKLKNDLKRERFKKRDTLTSPSPVLQSSSGASCQESKHTLLSSLELRVGQP